MNERLVKCKKLGKDLPGLEKPPFGGEIGKLIYENVSAEAWKSWKDDVQLKIINEYRLNMGLKTDYEVLVEQMLRYLNLKEGSVAGVEDAERGKSSPQ
jgi:Fe-S cluster biosynthesis and repair protein YggX